MRSAWAAIGLIASGCDVLFQVPAISVDAMVKVPDAGCTGDHDEDLDGVADACDNCPTVANPDQTDAGEIEAGATADGVGDACDPHRATSGDRIALFLPFTSGAPNARTIGTASFNADDVLISGEFSALITNMNFTPTRIVANLTLGATIPMQEVQLSTNSGGFRCDVTTAPCPATTMGGCLSAFIAPVVAMPLATPNQLAQLDMFEVDAGHLGCTATAGTSAATASDPAMFEAGQIAIYTLSATTQATVSSIVAYSLVE